MEDVRLTKAFGSVVTDVALHIFDLLQQEEFVFLCKTLEIKLKVIFVILIQSLKSRVSSNSTIVYRLTFPMGDNRS